MPIILFLTSTKFPIFDPDLSICTGYSDSNFTVNMLPGENYSSEDDQLLLLENFYGQIEVPFKIKDNNIENNLSQIDTLFITEKTWKPIVFKKPFLVWGGKGIHTKLKELGFELYEELFDYSFDNSSSRLDDLCNTIQPYMLMEPSMLGTSIDLTIKKKIEYNFNHYCELFNVAIRNRV